MNGTYLLTLITSVLCGNFVFHQLFGLEYAADSDENPGRILLRSLLTAVSMVIASALSFLICSTLAGWNSDYLNMVIITLILAGLEIGASCLTERIRPESGLYSGNIHVFLNSAVIAVVMTTADCTDLQSSIQLGIISAVGFLFASLIFWGVREKMETSDVPESFSGIPILVIAAGLCAMIFTGFSGLTF